MSAEKENDESLDIDYSDDSVADPDYTPASEPESRHSRSFPATETSIENPTTFAFPLTSALTTTQPSPTTTLRSTQGHIKCPFPKCFITRSRSDSLKRHIVSKHKGDIPLCDGQWKLRFPQLMAAIIDYFASKNQLLPHKKVLIDNAQPSTSATAASSATTVRATTKRVIATATSATLQPPTKSAANINNAPLPFTAEQLIQPLLALSDASRQILGKFFVSLGEMLLTPGSSQQIQFQLPITRMPAAVAPTTQYGNDIQPPNHTTSTEPVSVPRSVVDTVSSFETATITDYNETGNSTLTSEMPIDVTPHTSHGTDVLTTPVRNPNKTSSYACPYCDENFERKHERLLHYFSQHPDSDEANKYTCAHCRKTFYNTNATIAHENTCVPPLYKCLICSAVFNTAEILKDHFTFNHNVPT